MVEHELLRKYNYPEKEISKLIEDYSKGLIKTDQNTVKGNIAYPPEGSFKPLPPEESSQYKELSALGKKSIEKGELGVVILNGGMATRFGSEAKGTVEVFDGRSFLELKIKNALEVSDNLRFYIMNSFSTEEKTRHYFEERQYFGVPDKIDLFNQYIAPRITESGEYFNAREDKNQSFYGLGHGDFPYCFRSSGLLDKFIQKGGRYLFYSNVDNLGARVEPAILGFHIKESIDLTAEVALKSPGDEGGAPALVNGRLQLVEGFSFPEHFDDSMLPVFNCASYWAIAESLKKEFRLPWYVVKKKVEGKTVIQFERLAGDLTKFLDTVFLKVSRDDRFFPIKRPEDLGKNIEKLKEILGY